MAAASMKSRVVSSQEAHHAAMEAAELAAGADASLAERELRVLAERNERLAAALDHSVVISVSEPVDDKILLPGEEDGEDEEEDNEVKERAEGESSVPSMSSSSSAAIFRKLVSSEQPGEAANASPTGLLKHLLAPDETLEWVSSEGTCAFFCLMFFFSFACS